MVGPVATRASVRKRTEAAAQASKVFDDIAPAAKQALLRPRENHFLGAGDVHVTLPRGTKANPVPGSYLRKGAQKGPKRHWAARFAPILK